MSENCTPKRKRGPYKQYHFKDSSVSVPKSTQYELDHPEWKRARTSRSQKQVLQESRAQESNRQEQVCVTSKTSDVDPASYLETASSSDLIDNGNIPTSFDFVDDSNANDFDNQESLFQYNNDEEELFDLLCDDPVEDSDNNQLHDKSDAQLDDDDSPDDSEDEECATAPNLNLRASDKIKLLLLLATKKRHNLTYRAAESVMKLSGILNKDGEGLLLTKHLMKQAITSYSSEMTVHHMCSNCKFHIGHIENAVEVCNNCQHQVDPVVNKSNNYYFLYLSVREQIKALLESGLSPHVIDPRHRSKMLGSNFEDVFDGKLYKRLVPEGALSFNFFVDGLQVSSTSRYSAWPVLLTINEFPVHLRRKFVLMASVWLDKQKPDINQYMKPFVDECIDMYHNGITYKVGGITKVQQVVPLMCVSDSIARPLLRNSSQFNGICGCGLCYHPGYWLRFGKGHIRSYSIRQTDFPTRSHEETMELAREGERTGIVQQGIRGTFILSNIPNFDIVQCLDLDIFHCLVNVGKRYTNLWLGRKNRRQPYSVHHSLAVVDRRFLAITTTDNISRAPRSLRERADFRAHEWFHWIVFYSLPVMKNILPPRFLNHWGLLVHAIVLLMQNSVAKSELVYAGRYLKQFNQEIDLLYGSVHVTFSVHLLTHLENSVVNFAQPWTHSAFIFESFNGELKDSVKSSNGVAQQITNHMKLRIALQKMRADLDFTMTDQEKEYLNSMMTSSKSLADPHLVLGPVALLGEPKRLSLPAEYRHALVRADVAFDQNQEYSIYERCIVNSELIQSCHYKKVKRQVNSVVLLESDKVLKVQSFIIISDVCYAMGHYFKEQRQGKVCDVTLPHYLVLGENEMMLRCIPVSQFRMKLLSFTVKLSDVETLRLGCINVLKMEMLT